jgi:hypothetical protein
MVTRAAGHGPVSAGSRALRSSRKPLKIFTGSVLSFFVTVCGKFTIHRSKPYRTAGNGGPLPSQAWRSAGARVRSDARCRFAAARPASKTLMPRPAVILGLSTTSPRSGGIEERRANAPRRSSLT